MNRRRRNKTSHGRTEAKQKIGGWRFIRGQELTRDREWGAIEMFSTGDSVIITRHDAKAKENPG